MTLFKYIEPGSPEHLAQQQAERGEVCECGALTEIHYLPVSREELELLKRGLERELVDGCPVYRRIECLLAHS